MKQFQRAQIVLQRMADENRLRIDQAKQFLRVGATFHKQTRAARVSSYALHVGERLVHVAQCVARNAAKLRVVVDDLVCRHAEAVVELLEATVDDRDARQLFADARRAHLAIDLENVCCLTNS